ncbi:MAG: hypothetical protein GF388_06100, partial [Candidatus Aegiribacteria sp.]|nr:hypothetical protein [Candidatus Aegiribacteria sp.]MBD3294745.1 hypothetical protein [Candidatus Fermentibacteria bacterium]
MVSGIIEGSLNGLDFGTSGIVCSMKDLTSFQRQVLQQVKGILRGETETYGGIARAVGNPKA